MINFFLLIGVMMTGFTFFALAIHFSKYRTEPGRCCSSGVMGEEHDHDDDCFTCPKHGTDECALSDSDDPQTC